MLLSAVYARDRFLCVVSALAFGNGREDGPGAGTNIIVMLWPRWRTDIALIRSGAFVCRCSICAVCAGAEGCEFVSID